MNGTGMRGRRLLLGGVVVLPVLIALLLAGPRTEHQVCLRTLEQRHRTCWAVASLTVHTPEWTIDDTWPTLEGPLLAGSLPRPAAAPSQVAALLWPEGPPPHQWATTRRGMPFALFTQIENPRALPPRLRTVVEAQLVARTLLDPAEDGECLRALDGALVEGAVPPEALDRRERRRYAARPEAPGETLARDVLMALADAKRGGRLEAEAPALLCRLQAAP